MRIRGRCSRTCVAAGARTTTSRPAAHPKRTIEATPKTNESETPGGPTPSTGTGKRSASIDAVTSAASPSSVVVLWGVTANDTIAAHVTTSPATQTGATTASKRGGGRARCLTAPLPVQVVPAQVVVRACEREQEQNEDHGERNEAWTPLQHRQPPQKTRHDAVDSGFPA